MCTACQTNACQTNVSSLTDVAEVVLNKCIITIKKQNGVYVKKYYYEFLDDVHYKTHVEKAEKVESE